MMELSLLIKMFIGSAVFSGIINTVFAYKISTMQNCRLSFGEVFKFSSLTAKLPDDIPEDVRLKIKNFMRVSVATTIITMLLWVAMAFKLIR